MNAYEALPATLDGGRPCRNYPRCRRQAIDHSPLCGRCFDEALIAAFGSHVPERTRVERLSRTSREDGDRCPPYLGSPSSQVARSDAREGVRTPGRAAAG